jgi:hypothetical protein
MSRSSSLLWVAIALAGSAWAQDQPASPLAELKALAESATAAATADSYTAPDPKLKGAVDQQVQCKFSRTEAPDDLIAGYRAKFRALKWGQAVIDTEPETSNNARRCYYLALMALYQVK